MARKTNCIINGIPYYRIRRKIGNDEHGRPIMKPFYGSSKREAEKLADEYFDKKRNRLKSGTVYFSEISHHYTYNVLVKNSDYASSTINRYEGTYRNHLVDCDLWFLQMDEICAADIQSFYNDLRDEEGYTQSQIGAINKYLVGFFRWADLSGYCRNPMPSVVIPKSKEQSTPGEIVIFTEEEVQAIVSRAKKVDGGFLYLLALGTGLRHGELMGLSYADITPSGVRVINQLSRVVEITESNRFASLELTKVKSDSSVRSVPITESLYKEFLRHKKMHETEMLKEGYRTDFVFTTNTGQFVDPSSSRVAYCRFMAKALGVKKYDEKGFHTFRRTFCTMLVKNNPIEVVSRIMGHSDISVTAKYYAFVADQRQQQAVNSINNIFL